MDSKKVLIIEDEKSISDIIKFNLVKEGFEVETSYDGQEGLSKALSNKPDLILLDVMLPVMDGFQVCKKIRETNTIPIIMLTAKEEEVDKVLGLELGAGISPHYDLVKPMNRIVAFKDLLANKEMPYDDDGHGTHVAGLIAGNGYTSCKYIGTAPCANIISIKALDDSGNGTESDILAALQWIINNGRLYNIRVINLSLGVKVEPDNEGDSLVKGANAAVRHGYTVVTAAGNNGPGKCTINSPGISPMVITVGAADMTKFDESGNIKVASFSSRGPTFSGIIKPDLIAPGVDICSLDAKNPKNYSIQTGTSMSAPLVSGVAACLYASNPCLTPAQVKRILLREAIPLKNEDRCAQGCGLLNYRMFLNL